MAKKPKRTVAKTEIEKLPRNEQRFFLDQGLADKAPAPAKTSE